MTNEQAIARTTERFATVRRNKDGSLNGNAVHGHYKTLKAAFKANGMDHNEACAKAGDIVRELKAQAS